MPTKEYWDGYCDARNAKPERADADFGYRMGYGAGMREARLMAQLNELWREHRERLA